MAGGCQLKVGAFCKRAVLSNIEFIDLQKIKGHGKICLITKLSQLFL